MNSHTSDKTHGVFFPLLLIAVSVVIMLSWDLNQMILAHSSGVQISARQEAGLAQAVQVEERLKLIMADLVELANSDEDARTIVKRYNIVFTPTAQPDSPDLPGVPTATTPEPAQDTTGSP